MESLFYELMDIRPPLPNQVIIDCLLLYPYRRAEYRLQYDELMDILQACNKAHIRTKLRRLRKYNLIEYEAGTLHEPGFKQIRIGPPPSPH